MRITHLAAFGRVPPSKGVQMVRGTHPTTPSMLIWGPAKSVSRASCRVLCPRKRGHVLWASPALEGSQDRVNAELRTSVRPRNFPFCAHGMATPLTWVVAGLPGLCYWHNAENLPCTTASGVPGSGSTQESDELESPVTGCPAWIRLWTAAGGSRMKNADSRRRGHRERGAFLSLLRISFEVLVRGERA